MQLDKIILNGISYDIGGSGDGLTESIKSALLVTAQNVAYIDTNGATYYQNLYDALYPSAGLTRITAVYTQTGTVYDTASLDDLKPNLVVTAYYDNSTSRVLLSNEYTLSGTLVEGTSTITASYGVKSATFTVTVSTFTTSPVIATEGVCWSKTAPDTVSKEGFGVTQWYDYEFTQEILESSPYWDSTNQYMTTNGWTGLRVCTPDYLAYAAGYSWPASANYKHVAGKDHVYINNNSITRNTEINFNFSRQSVNWVQNNCLSFSMPLLDKEYAYAYWNSATGDNTIFPSGVTSGDIIFAGRNTPYYGCTNISEAPTLSSISAVFTQGSTVVTTSSTLASLKSMLEVTALYDNGKTLPVNLGMVTLTGELTTGTSTITATYNDKTTTFNVTVS